jgi:hypothetical protein
MTAQAQLFTTPHVGTRWRVTGPHAAFRVYEVTAIEADGEFVMTLREDSREERDPGRIEVGWEMRVESAWFMVRAQLPIGKEGAVRPA